MNPTSGPPIGVEPRKATDHSDMTRPRMDGSDSSCRVELPRERNVTEQAPTKQQDHRLHRQRGGQRAASSTATPNTAAVRHQPLRARRAAGPAAIRPPTTAPMPMQAVRNP